MIGEKEEQQDYALSYSRNEILSTLNSKYKGPLQRFFLRKIRCRNAAEDLTQEVFVRLVRYTKLESIRDPSAFIFQTAANLLRDHVRRLETSDRKNLPIDGMDDSICHALKEEIHPERVLQAKEEMQIVVDALRELDQRTRTIFILHRVDRMKQKDIAALLEISVSQVEKQVVRAMAHLALRVQR